MPEGHLRWVSVLPGDIAQALGIGARGAIYVGTADGLFALGP